MQHWLYVRKSVGQAARTLGVYDRALLVRERISERRAEHRAREQRRALRRLYAGFIAPGDLCFDIGANTGERTRIFLALGARTIAVEPQADCATRLNAEIADAGLLVVQKAVGRAEGVATIWTSPEANTIASMSRDWISRVKNSGRFSFDWKEAIEVEVTTLDALITTHGLPTFCKIDVEGFEAEVLAGLSQPIGALSFEFTPEYLESAVAGLERLRSLGYGRFTYSLGESGKVGKWIGSEQLLAELERFQDDSRVFGDIYAKYP
jgi:FkbM family methyltransferase